ncbi:hypothetical protein D3C86_990710 [compost metagenome]
MRIGVVAPLLGALLLVALPAAAFQCAGCARPAATSSAVVEARALRGTVSYRERIALLPGATLTVTLVDVSRADAPAEVISRRSITVTGQVPIAFSLPYDAAAIRPGHRYAVQAELVADGTRWINTDPYPVFGDGDPAEPALLVRRVDQ